MNTRISLMSLWIKQVILMTAFPSLGFTLIDFVAIPFLDRVIKSHWLALIPILMFLGVITILLGAGQWLLFKPYIARAGQWGLITAIIYWLGSSIIEGLSFGGWDILPAYAIGFLLLGPVCGIFQWNLLRAQVHRASWWILTQTLIWPLLVFVASVVASGAATLKGGNMFDYLPLGYAVGGAAAGALMGGVLLLLLGGRVNPVVDSIGHTL